MDTELTGTWEKRVAEVGGWKITALSDGFLRLDGGAMWGVVPAAFWRSMTPPAEDNTILLALNCFLAEKGAHKVLIEGGVGDRWNEKLRGIYHIQGNPTIGQSLASVGVAPEEITEVVLSHCHWDHCGALVIERDGKLVPRFPNASVHAPSIEIACCQNPDPVRAASYRADDLGALDEAGLLHGYTETKEILPGIEAHVLGGHSDGVSVILIGEGKDRAVFWADVVPTTHHIQPPYIMAYDLDVARSYEVRKEWIERSADEGWLGLFYHDPLVSMARIEREGKRFSIATAGS